MPDPRDIYRYGVELVKAYEDDDGNWIVEGIASTNGKDEQDEIVEPRGLETSYFLNKGFIKWEHAKTPKVFIGEPLEAKVLKSGQFWIKGKLYKHAPLAQEAIEAAKTLEKSGARRKIGFSIEATVVARDPKNPKRVTKAILRNVAMTFNPVNTDTWAELAKSLETLEVDLETTCNCGHSCGANCCQITGKECLHKTLDTGAGAPLMPESIEDKLKTQDVPPEDDEEEDKKTKLTRSFLTYVKSLLARRKRKLAKGLNSGMDAADELGAFIEATEGLGQEEAEFLASYIAQKSLNITSLVNNPTGGGNGMPDELTKALDESLEILNKSVAPSEGTEEEKGEEEGEEVQKSFTDNLKEEDAVEKAFEVSDFLEVLAEGIGDHIDGFGSKLEKSLSQQNETIGVIAQTLQATAVVIKSLGAELAEQKTLVKSLTEQVEELSQQPVGRKSVVNAREAHTIQKSFGVQGGQAPQKLPKSAVVDMLVKSFEAGEIKNPNVITTFELSGYLPPEISERLGIAQ